MKNFIQNKVINLALIGLAGLPVTAQQREQKPQRPNVLFIAVDDLKPVLGCYGNKLIRTPNIDRLANHGTVFLNNYVQQAISGATRASCLTGKRPDYTRTWDLITQMREVNPDIITLPQYFKNQGYTSAGIGKIYHPSCVVRNDEPSWSIPYLDANDSYAKEYGRPAFGLYQDPATKSAAEKLLKEAAEKGLSPGEAFSQALKQIKPSVECVNVPDDAYADGAVAVKAKKQLIALTKNERAFFFAVGFIKPHLPFVAPKKYWDLYDRNEMPLAKFQEHAKKSPEIAYHRSGELKNYTDIPEMCTFTDQGNQTKLNIDKQKELVHGYYAAVSYIDAQVGILLNTLDSLGIRENTIIVLWGDHGWHLGDHDLWNKHTNLKMQHMRHSLFQHPA
jgi:arylsulfatase A-like enzyme